MLISEFAAGLKLMWPTIEKRCGCYVIVTDDSKPSEAYIKDWLNHTKGNVRAAERVINHRHVGHLVPCASRDSEPEELRIIARVYTAILKEILKSTYPSAKFEIATEGESLLDKSPGDYVVTFFSA